MLSHKEETFFKKSVISISSFLSSHFPACVSVCAYMRVCAHLDIMYDKISDFLLSSLMLAFMTELN